MGKSGVRSSRRDTSQDAKQNQGLTGNFEEQAGRALGPNFTCNSYGPGWDWTVTASPLNPPYGPYPAFASLSSLPGTT